MVYGSRFGSFPSVLRWGREVPLYPSFTTSLRAELVRSRLTPLTL
jgi:hypothetical protein